MKEEFTSQIVKQEDTRATIKITIPSEIVNKTFNALYQNLAKQINVPGYRFRRAPKQAVLKAIGGQKVLQEDVGSALVNYYYPKALAKHQLVPINAEFQGMKPLEGQNYTFTINIELYPVVKLPKLEDIVIETKIEQVTDEMFSQKIEDLRMQNALYIPANGQSAQTPDIVYLQWLDDSEEGLLLIDLHTTQPEIAQQLEGKKIGETFNFSPTPDFLEALNKTSNLFDGLPFSSPQVTIKEIKTCILPKVNEDFAKILGFDSWVKAKKSLLKNLRTQLNEKGLQAQKDELLEKLATGTQTKIPKMLIEHHKELLLDELAHKLAKEGKNLEEHLNNLKSEHKYKDFEAQLEVEGIQQAKKDLVLEALVRELNITLGEKEFTKNLESVANSEGSTVNELKESRGQDWLNNYRFFLTCEKALEKLVGELSV